MNSLLASTCSLLDMFDGKLQEFASNVDKVHMVWLEEIQQEANRMFSSDFSAEPELMPKTPSQKKRSRRNRISSGRDESLAMRRFSKGKRSNLRTSSVRALKLITEDEGVLSDRAPQEETSEEKRPKRNTRRNNKQQSEAEPPKRSTRQASQRSSSQSDGDARGEEDADPWGPSAAEPASSAPEPQAAAEQPGATVSAAELLSVELQQGLPPCRIASKLVITRPLEAHAVAPSPRRSSMRPSLKLRRSLAGLRHSMTQESVRRASRRSFLKKARMSGSSCSSSASGGVSVEMDEEKAEERMEDAEYPAETETDLLEPKFTHQEAAEEEEIAEPLRLSAEGVQRVTRSMAQTTPPPAVSTEKSLSPDSVSRSSMESDDSGKKCPATTSSLRSRPSSKRRAAEPTEEVSSPLKRASPPQKSQTAVRPNMKSFLHTVAKNQLLMSTPGSLSRSTMVKSFIKRTTPLRVDLKERERLRLEALKKKQEQEIERKKKMEEEKRRKQEEMKRKRDERLRKVVEARVKEELREEEKKKKIEQKLAQMEVKNDKLRVERLAEEKAKKKVANKRQEELELRKKQEEEARRKKILLAEEEEKRQQEFLVKRRAEEEQERARRLAEVRRMVEFRKEQEREREQEQERERLRQQQVTAERERLERVEREKALTLQRELEKAAREKELREAEERKVKEERQRLAEQERQRRAEQERQRLAEQERQRRAEQEKQRLTEQERQRVAEQERQRVAEQERQRVAEQERQRRAEQEKQRLAEQDRAAAVAAATRSTFAVEMQKSIMKTPVGKATGLNVTVDIENSIMKTPVGKATGLDVEHSPQSYEITPKGGNKPVVVNTNPEDYGMDQNSDDSTDDESAPRKPIPSWAEGRQLQQVMLHQYFNPVDVDSYFGEVEEPKLEKIFYKSKPRYFKRTSSAVWQSPPRMGPTTF